jgi:hypothetical protein
VFGNDDGWIMNQDEDVDRLFSWLQTPDIRYREFAGAREVTDATVSYQLRTNTPDIGAPAPHNVQLDEEYPADQFPDQSQVRVEIEPARQTPPTVVPTPAPVAPPPAPIVPTPVVSAPAPSDTRPAEGGPFALGAAGRGASVPAPPPIAAPAPAPVAPPPAPAASGSGPAGETRENSAPAPVSPPETGGEGTARPLTSVFNRLAGSQSDQPDPRDRLRHIPGLGPTNDRSR